MIGVGAVILIGLVVFLALHLHKNAKIRKSNEEADKKVEESASHLALCFGGNDNIEEITQTGSRVSVKVKDPSKVDKEKIDQELSSVMYMGNKVVFVIGSKSEEFSTFLKENVGKTK